MSFYLRLTLGNNRLSTLPTELELFTRLRYLNLRRNNFSTFPDVVSFMNWLDISGAKQGLSANSHTCA